MEQWETGFPRLRAAYEAWNSTKGASIDQWTELLADELDFRSLAGGKAGVPWTSTCRTREEVRTYLTGLTSTFRMEHYTVERFVCQGDAIVVVATTAWQHIASGRRLDSPIITMWRFRNGKAFSFFEYYDTAAVAAAVGA